MTKTPDKPGGVGMKTSFLSVVGALLSITLNTVSATPLAGDAVFLDPTNQSVGTIRIIGDLDTSNSSMVVDPFSFFGLQWDTQEIELLGTGTYTRPDGYGGNISTTVNPGQLGAYMTFNWGANVMPNFMVWDANSSPGGSSYTTADSDGDGIPGQAFLAGPFPGFSLAYDFIVGNPPPDIDITIGAIGGTTQECAETGGSTVSLSTTINLVGDATLGSIEWYIDGQVAGSGDTLTSFLTLGTHSIGALASTTTGESDSDYLDVTIIDTTAPALATGFLDQAGNPVTSTTAGNFVRASIIATDVCDPAPDTEGAATPVFAINNGDAIKIQSGKVNTVELPTTAIELSASATDASGNSGTGMAVLSITD